MKKSGVVLLLLVICLNLMVVTAFAAEGKTGVVNYVEVITKSQAGKQGDAEIKALIEAKKTEVSTTASKIETLKNELGANDLDADAKQAKQQELLATAREYQKAVAAANMEISKKTTELRTQIRNDISVIVNQIGKEGNYVMIFDASMVPYYQGSVNLTREVLQKYDASKK